MSALDTQIASVEAALENHSQIQALRGKVEELLEKAFPSDGYYDGFDLVDEAMEFFRLGVEDVLLKEIPWSGDNGAEVNLSARAEFFAELGCPFEIAESREEETPVLDRLIAEAPDEMDRPATEKELRAFFSSTREMLKEDGNE